MIIMIIWNLIVRHYNSVFISIPICLRTNQSLPINFIAIFKTVPMKRAPSRFGGKEKNLPDRPCTCLLTIWSISTGFSQNQKLFRLQY